MDTQDAYSSTWVEMYVIYMVTRMSAIYCPDLHVRTCTIVFKAIFIINTTLYQLIISRVMMHVYVHLAFKELNYIITILLILFIVGLKGGVATPPWIRH